MTVTVADQLSGYADITCYFAKESIADECRITLQEYNNSLSCNFSVPRKEEDKATITVILPSGTYTLLAYDYEARAVDNPAFTTTLSVHSSPEVSGIVNVHILYIIAIFNIFTECAPVPSDKNLYSTSETNVICKFIQLVSSP